MMGLWVIMSYGISIHALREEGDELAGKVKTALLEFLSTPSARRATVARRVVVENSAISIHALREEGDIRLGQIRSRIYSISIHALREEGDV